jgi:hypothetical protein
LLRTNFNYLWRRRSIIIRGRGIEYRRRRRSNTTTASTQQQNKYMNGSEPIEEEKKELKKNKIKKP